MKKRGGSVKRGILGGPLFMGPQTRIRMGNSTLSCSLPRLAVFVLTSILLLYLLNTTLFSRKSDPRPQSYNSTYPLSQPQSLEGGITSYAIGILTDLDTDSKNGSNSWRSFFKRGTLLQEPGGHYKISFEETKGDGLEIRSKLSYGGRGMELSELVVFNGSLYSCDDRTGVVYRLLLETKGIVSVPWVILSDGNGLESKGFKCEWMTVKDEHLYVGGLGKEWTTPDGVVLNHNPMFVKRISPSGAVEHLDWFDVYIGVRRAAGIEAPGYMIHEAIEWNPLAQKWFFLPRRASVDKYDDVTDEEKGTNFLLRLRPGHLEDVEVLRVGGSETIQNPSHGFSSFKFIPGTNHQHIVALKSQELKGSIASFIMVLDSEGNILLPETKIGDFKYEGVEFI
uniref:Apyrase n=1 Tax=Caligus rogercresseyi TaxID=217165 RepID=C1BQZ5_CALRO|nr:Soluble calcium-activated nucleotidase 1 [Caligus rogercresseyi]